jgi:predicted Fe-Mo cluster-binding NifX family protein
MRIAIPSEGDKGLEDNVAMHFGKAPYYTFVDVDLENKKILKVEVIPVPFESHDPGDLPLFVKEHDGELVMAYGMGIRAQEFFNYMRIKVLTGIYGKIGEVLNLFLEGKIHELIDGDWKNKEDFKKDH